MNYNILTDEMHFISQWNDTFAIDNEPTIKFISLSSDTFYYDKGFVMFVKSNNDFKLGIRQSFKIPDKKRAADYDGMNSTSSISSVNSIDDRKFFHQLEVKEQVIIINATQLCLGDKYNHFVSVSKKMLVDLFPGAKALLNDFPRRNKLP